MFHNYFLFILLWTFYSVYLALCIVNTAKLAAAGVREHLNS